MLIYDQNTISNLHSRYPYGFYRVGEQIFESRVDAILFSEETKTPFIYDFNDQYLDSFDWTKEPEESLSELYLRRAISIREKYDYLVLHYSGGFDSHNILETFLYNGLKIDEVIIRVVKEEDMDSKNYYSEAAYYAYPFAKKIKKEFWPDLKITVANFAEVTHDLYKDKRIFKSAYEALVVDPLHLTRSDHELFSPDLIKIQESGKTVAHMIGMDKPRVLRDNTGIYCVFEDLNIWKHYRPRTIYRNKLPPQNSELFYHHVDNAKLLIKQAHQVARYLEINDLPEIKRDRAGEDIIASLIYDRKHHNNIINCEKPPERIVTSAIGRWFFDKSNDHYRNWARTTWDILKFNPANHVWEDKKAFRSYQSRPHYIKRY